MTRELINIYRPLEFEAVIGASQQAACRSIQTALKRGLGRSFLLSGPSGVGKTTIARIIAQEVGCAKSDVLEIDGATSSSVDDMRAVTAHLKFKNLGGEPRAIIVDECHAISAQAWKSLLKSIEEPPEGIYWILCTTDYSKVPKEIKTRCLDYKLKTVENATIDDLLMDVAKNERLPIRSNFDALQVISENAEGSPRLALSLLAKCGHLKEEEEVEALCSGDVSSSAEAIELCRLLMKNANFNQCIKCINKINVSPESVRIIVLRYMSAVILKGKTSKDILAVMEEFSEPFQDREGKAPLILAVARILLQ